MKTRRPRRSADETRTQLIEAGIAELRKAGMSIGLDAVNLEQAVRDANVPRSSAYAVWSSEDESSPQEAFQSAVLRAVVEQRKRTLEELAEDSIATLMGFEGVPRDRKLMRELIRQTTERNATLAAESIEWKLTIALRAILSSIPQESRDQELVSWLTESAVLLREYTLKTIYRPLAEEFDMAPRPEYGERAYELAETALAVLGEGFATRDMVEAPGKIEGLNHPDEAEGSWTLYSLLCERVIELFFIPKSGSWEDF